MRVNEHGLALLLWLEEVAADPDGTALARRWMADRLDRMGPADAQATVIREIEKLRPAARGALEAGGFHSWWLDPHNAGDWAIFAPGQVQGLLPTMAQPHGRLHFCGEHTANDAPFNKLPHNSNVDASNEIGANWRNTSLGRTSR